MKVRNPTYLWLAGSFALFGASHLASGKDTVIGVLYLVVAVVGLGRALFTSPRPPSDPEELGPGALRATPAGRFRATGWPPAKDADAYR